MACALALAACQSKPGAPAPRPTPRRDIIPCAQGTAALTPTCTVELDHGQLTVHNPDGGFHRLRLATDGHGVVAADGAQAARVTAIDANTIEVAIGVDRYRLPATVERR